MVPTMILVGVVLGRWWRTALVVGAVGWPVILVADNVDAVEFGLVGAAVIGVVNTAVGVALHHAVLALIRRSRGQVALPSERPKRRIALSQLSPASAYSKPSCSTDPSWRSRRFLSRRSLP